MPECEVGTKHANMYEVEHMLKCCSQLGRIHHLFQCCSQ